MVSAASTDQRWLWGWRSPKNIFQSGLCSSELQDMIRPIVQMKTVCLKELKWLAHGFLLRKASIWHQHSTFPIPIFQLLCPVLGAHGVNAPHSHYTEPSTQAESLVLDFLALRPQPKHVSDSMSVNCYFLPERGKKLIYPKVSVSWRVFYCLETHFFWFEVFSPWRPVQDMWSPPWWALAEWRAVHPPPCSGVMQCTFRQWPCLSRDHA